MCKLSVEPRASRISIPSRQTHGRASTRHPLSRGRDAIEDRPAVARRAETRHHRIASRPAARGRAATGHDRREAPSSDDSLDKLRKVTETTYRTSKALVYPFSPRLRGAIYVNVLSSAASRDGSAPPPSPFDEVQSTGVGRGAAVRSVKTHAQNVSAEPLLLKIFVCVTVTSAGPTQAATLLDPTL